MPLRLRQEIEAMHIQGPAHRSKDPFRSPSLSCTAKLSLFNKYSTADAFLLLESAAGTVERRDEGVRRNYVILAIAHLTLDWMGN
jgi:hypothetical protein